MSKPANPGTFTPLGIVLADEPEEVNVSVFADDGSVLLTINCRPGGNVGQMIIGLTAAQTLQLIERLQAHADVCGQAIAKGKGGRRFKGKP